LRYIVSSNNHVASNNRKDSYFEAHNEREQAGDANRRKNLQRLAAMQLRELSGRYVSGCSR